MVDTGVVTTVIPSFNSGGIGHSARPNARLLSTTGGEQVQLDMAEARAVVEGRETYTWVIFGETGIAVAPILGAVYAGRRVPLAGEHEVTQRGGVPVEDGGLVDTPSRILPEWRKILDVTLTGQSFTIDRADYWRASILLSKQGARLEIMAETADQLNALGVAQIQRHSNGIVFQKLDR